VTNHQVICASAAMLQCSCFWRGTPPGVVCRSQTDRAAGRPMSSHKPSASIQAVTGRTAMPMGAASFRCAGCEWHTPPTLLTLFCCVHTHLLCACTSSLLALCMGQPPAASGALPAARATHQQLWHFLDSECIRSDPHTAMGTYIHMCWQVFCMGGCRDCMQAELSTWCFGRSRACRT